MQAAVKANEGMSDKTAIEALFSYLDKGIDDVEAGRVHTVDEVSRFWFSYSGRLASVNG